MVALFDIPEPNGTIAATGRDGTPIASEVKRVDVLLMPGEGVADLLLMDIPNLPT